jgi:DNA polymerase III delta prime subunit
MGRPERPLDATGGPIAAFARDLRALRSRAGNRTYRELARRALFSPSVLSSAASGYRLPSLPVTLAFVAACDGDLVAWEQSWRAIAGHLTPAAETARERRPAVVPSAAPRPAEAAAGTELPVQEAACDLARPAQLPSGSGTFAGRVQPLASACQVIEKTGPTRTPIMISGPVGVGKTAFALRLADTLSGEFPDGQLYADLSARASASQSSDDIICGFLRALGAPAPLVPDDPGQRIGFFRSILAQRRLLVLLENARDECQIRPLLGRATHSQVVVTSRARLLGLDGTHRIELSAFARQESMALIGQLVGPERVQAEYQAANTIAELCADLPLAVDIIGRKIAARPEWAIAHIAERLANRDRLLDSLSVGDINVRDRFASAYELLPSAARQAVRKLGLGGAGWETAPGLGAAMGISAVMAEELLESLVDAGLLTQANVAGRYCISTLLSAFAAAAEPGVTDLTVPLGCAVRGGNRGVSRSIRARKCGESRLIGAM